MPEQRDRTVLFVGRLSKQKDPLTLLRGWQRTNANGEYRLLVVGDGPLTSSIQQTILELSLQNVELLGTQEDLLHVYHEASVLALPSLSEGCSNALLEAMACGLCPVVTDIGGNRDVITDRVNGRLVAARDERCLGDVLSELLADKETRDRLAGNARAHVVAHHAANSIARRYVDLFEQMVE
jgi:glycosyltransferase involved in cell wall biosynthesis